MMNRAEQNWPSEDVLEIQPTTQDLLDAQIEYVMTLIENAAADIRSIELADDSHVLTGDTINSILAWSSQVVESAMRRV